ncbi:MULTISPECIES: DUF3105 domain-containing protein [Nocardioides]|uniref:DUF3105 domain-containing protein n=1 Tax=Nocardioides lianchengensis TaxID=1045774 RepID=A0A1G6JW39_9ACTN|nr:DUF3105 domain-containing protein [Nocardioides lianchengensis]NYG08802.1 hypothetical protein [Nocardioides lianchengensis]SDC22989.1 Protein of unknown function [Nocardioides lianchengensis]
MAKTPKSAKSDRQAVIDEIRKKQKGAEKRRGFAIVGVCAVIALLIIGAAAYGPLKDKWDERAYSDVALDEIGAAADTCQKVTTVSAEGSGDHVPETQQVTYDHSPPAFGSHWNAIGSPAPFERKFYTKEDRPELESLVHNLEHGYNIIWYDDTIAKDGDAMDELRAIAAKYQGTGNFRQKVIVAPFTAEDDKESGGEFPKDTHVAFTHWSVGGAGETDTTKQVGVWQYCGDVSGAAFEKFTLDYPYLDSPEPNVQ